MWQLEMFEFLKHFNLFEFMHLALATFSLSVHASLGIEPMTLVLRVPYSTV